jgi:dimethylaniline monooxygenase (N-oxide forming)
MTTEIERHTKAVQQRYVGSARYVLEVDARRYTLQLNSDMQQNAGGA